MHQQLITAGVAEVIVHRLEAVQIEKHDGKVQLGMPLLASHGELQAVEKQGPVGQAGQRIVQGVMLQASVGLFLLADVTVTDKIAHFHPRHADRSHQDRHIDELA